MSDDYHGDFQVPPTSYARIGDPSWESDARTLALRAELGAALNRCTVLELDHMRLDGALEEVLHAKQFPMPHDRLADVVRTRYGRECEQWKANHAQRKAERDAAIVERDSLRAQLKQALEAADAATKEIERLRDKRQARVAERATHALRELLKVFDGREMTTHEQQAALREARAAVTECEGAR